VSDDHARAVELAFASQAAAFEDPRSNKVFTEDVGWLFAELELDPDQLALDVAAGTGHAARWLAASVRAVVAFDVTAAMLERGQAAAAAAGLRNIVFARGDAAALPFPDGSFDVVVCRFAVHHFEDPAVVLEEMLRCLRPGGQLVVADLVADPDLADQQNRLERLRDPSHGRILTLAELQTLLERLGAVVTAVAARDVDRPLAPWLAHAGAPEPEITAILRAEIDGGSPTGMRPRDRDGEIWFSQRFGAVTAR
jgi:SAM-dependent methyltransferase